MCARSWVDRTNSEPHEVVVIIDDDPAVRDALANLLESARYTAEAFHCCEDFLAAVPFRLPACLILDVKLPGIGGLDLQRQLLDSGISVPIIFISGHSTEELRNQALASGALAFLSKPFRDSLLLQHVRQAMEKPQLEKPAAPKMPAPTQMLAFAISDPKSAPRKE